MIIILNELVHIKSLEHGLADSKHPVNARYCPHVLPLDVYSLLFYFIVFEMESHSVAQGGAHWCDLGSLQPLPPGYK